MDDFLCYCNICYRNNGYFAMDKLLKRATNIENTILRNKRNVKWAINTQKS